MYRFPDIVALLIVCAEFQEKLELRSCFNTFRNDQKARGVDFSDVPLDLTRRVEKMVNQGSFVEFDSTAAAYCADAWMAKKSEDILCLAAARYVVECKADTSICQANHVVYHFAIEIQIALFEHLNADALSSYSRAMNVPNECIHQEFIREEFFACVDADTNAAVFCSNAEC